MDISFSNFLSDLDMPDYDEELAPRVEIKELDKKSRRVWEMVPLCLFFLVPFEKFGIVEFL